MNQLTTILKNAKKAILVLMISMAGFSGMAQWELVMQEGGNIYSLIETESIMYAGTQFGVFKSVDDGVNWFEANNGLTNTVVHPMLSSGSRIFAGTEAGIFISDNQGENWVESNEGLTISKINCLLNTDEGIYAGTDDQGVYFSSDNGDNWSALNSGLTNLSVKAMVKNGNRLFAGTDGAGVFYSDNEGGTWTQTNTGLSSWFIKHLAVKDSKVYVSTNSNFCISANNGLSWSALSTPFGHEVLCSVNHSEYMFVGTNGDGVFYTTDEGNTWTDWSEELENKNMYTIEIFDDYVWSACCCGFGLFKRLLPDITSTDNSTEKDDIVIITNQANNNIHINTSGKKGRLKIINQQGQVILQEYISYDEKYIDISKLSTGIYVVVFETGKRISAKKLIIQ